jgi:hypothetical protein
MLVNLYYVVKCSQVSHGVAAKGTAGMGSCGVPPRHRYFHRIKLIILFTTVYSIVSGGDGAIAYDPPFIRL